MGSDKSVVCDLARAGFLEQLRQHRLQWSEENATAGYASILIAYAVFVCERGLHTGVKYSNGDIRWVGEQRALLRVERPAAVQFLKVAVNEWGLGKFEGAMMIVDIIR